MNYEEEIKEKIALAKNQSIILKKLFQSINEDTFNFDIDFSDISSEKLRDFWLYNTGFMGIINYENDDNFISIEEADAMIQGEFFIKKLSDEEFISTLKSAGITEKRFGYHQIYDLYTIQDGTYKAIKNYPASRVSIENRLYLKTEPIKIFTDNPFFDTDPSRILKLIRNSLAHNVPLISDNEIILKSGNDEISVSNMWMRGFAESFARAGIIVDENKILSVLQTQLPLQRNYIENEKDLIKAISTIKDCFDEKTKANFHRVNNFLKTRINYVPNFFQRNLDEKIKIITTICANNSSYLTSKSGSIAPSIIYNLQQLVALELAKRGEDVYLAKNDPDIISLKELRNQRSEIMDRFDNFKKNNPNIRTNSQKIQLNNFKNSFFKLTNAINKLIEIIENKIKLECSNMELSDPKSLKFMPAEVAVNIVLLMAFNNFVTSGFYDDLLANTDFYDLNPEQMNFFNHFNLSKFNITLNSKKPDVLNSSCKAFLLSCMRNSLCHGLVEYYYPPIKNNECPSFHDIIITFNTDAGTIISGKLIDFYKLFTYGGFTIPRKPEIITNKSFIESSDSSNEIIDENLSNSSQQDKD